MKAWGLCLLLWRGAAAFLVLPPTPMKKKFCSSLKMSTQSGMMDAHKILGVSWYANMDEIKSAYRRLAKLYHPDANPGRDTTPQFQEINRAYQVLREETNSYSHHYNGYAGSTSSSHHQQYYGKEVDLGNKGFDSYFRNYKGYTPYTGPSYSTTTTTTTTTTQTSESQRKSRADTSQQQQQVDLNDTYFGKQQQHRSAYSSGGKSPTDYTTYKKEGPSVVIGRDIRIDLEIDYQTSRNGGQVKVRTRSKTTCSDCGGHGIKRGVSNVQKCRTCGGVGVVLQQRMTPFGRYVGVQSTCPSCHGSGHYINDCCTSCKGLGTIEKLKTLAVTIPPGVVNGNMLCVRGEGDAGPYGGPSGDLYIFLTVREEVAVEMNTEEAIGQVDDMLRETVQSAIMEDLESHRWQNFTTVHP